MAEPEMCIPYMKRLAEQRSDRIIETSPNGIVILDERLDIMAMNPAFRKFFMCSEACLGKPIDRSRPRSPGRPPPCSRSSGPCPTDAAASSGTRSRSIQLQGRRGDGQATVRASSQQHRQAVAL